MPRRRRIHLAGGFYHVTLRGNHQLPIFVSAADRGLLNRIVARALEKYGARLHAYCWMTNHLHFLIQVGSEPLAGIMRQIAGEFARAMQSKLMTTGHFFERRHHATLIEATDYLFNALRYVHRNPIEAGICATLDDYPWTSHHAYCGRRQDAWLTTDFILSRFASEPTAAITKYQAFMAAEPVEGQSPFPEGAYIFGSDEFIERIRGVDPRQKSNQRLQELIAEACKRFEVTPEQLTSPVRNRYLTKTRGWIAHHAAMRGIADRATVARTLGRSEGALRRAIVAYPEEMD